MRRLTPGQDDRGVTTLFVVLMMPILLLFAAFTLDGGRGVLARRQTQNAADAAALAKATDCAKTPRITTTSFTRVRDQRCSPRHDSPRRHVGRRHHHGLR